LTLVVRAHELLALIGPNGAGKSTLFKVAMGLLRPQQGMVTLDGQDLTQLTIRARVGRGLAYLIQGGEVFPSLTVRENLELSALSLPPADRRVAQEVVLDQFPALRRQESVRSGLLSGGQRQVLAVGMVLVKRPRVLLLDEPSAGLSPDLVGEVLKIVQSTNREWGTTVVLVEQNLRGALTVAHRAVVLVDGQVVQELGDPAAWLIEGRLERLLLPAGAADVAAAPVPAAPAVPGLSGSTGSLRKG
jgi:branched-chain amino acid transport system ATP-binding protein